MPQGPYQIVIVPNGGLHSLLNITAATVVKSTSSSQVVLSVTTAGSTTGLINDTNTVASVAASNLVFSIPEAVGVYVLNWPFAVGVTITPGTGQVLSVSYS